MCSLKPLVTFLVRATQERRDACSLNERSAGRVVIFHQWSHSRCGVAQNVRREWLCGGIIDLSLALAGRSALCLDGVISLGGATPRRGRRHVGACGVARGDCNHVSPGARGSQAPAELPRAGGLSNETSQFENGRCEAVINQSIFQRQSHSREWVGSGSAWFSWNRI